MRDDDTNGIGLKVPLSVFPHQPSVSVALREPRCSSARTKHVEIGKMLGRKKVSSVTFLHKLRCHFLTSSIVANKDV